MSTAHVSVDLGFGDAGKGTTVDYLARTHGATLTVRTNGGSQAAHNVMTAEGRHHTFSQFGAATLVPGVRSLIAGTALASPIACLNENESLKRVGVHDALPRLLVSRECLVNTPVHVAVNRLREILRGEDRHGSVGVGIGAAMEDMLTHPEDALRIGDLEDHLTVIRKLRRQRDRAAAVFKKEGVHLADMDAEIRQLLSTGEYYDYAEVALNFLASGVTLLDQEEERRLIREHPTDIVFESAQGVLLDEWVGFHPYTTWSTCTFEHPLKLLEAAGHEGEVLRYGIARAYGVRHGAGPFPTEDKGLCERIQDYHNGLHEWQGRMRVGHFDAVLIRYALEAVGGVDRFVLTCVDRLAGEQELFIANAYELKGGRMKSIPLPLDVEDLGAREQFTRELFGAKPVLQKTADQHSPHMLRGHVEMIEECCGLPVNLISAGPTERDKMSKEEFLTRAP